ncbi:MAG: phosphopyruvate hydratase, partial [Alphaproteobacteria bacterium]
MSNNDITGIAARRVWDSRGRPTVEVEATLSGGATGRAIAPAGASRGANEAIDLRDGGEDLGGFGVEKALDNIADEIAPLLEGMDAEDQEAVDLAMIECDDTDDKSRLGGNAIVAVSMAVLGAMAASRKLPLWQHLAGDAQVRLPMPEIQIFGGGAHAGRRVDIQDFMAVPVGAETFDEALEMVAEVYLAAGQLMQDAGKLAGVADEGGWWPVFETNEEALDALVRAIEEADLEPGADVAISLDIAASEFGKDGQYRLGLEKRELDGDGMIELLAGWLDRYPIVSIEDPLGEDDAENMKRFTE